MADRQKKEEKGIRATFLTLREKKEKGKIVVDGFPLTSKRGKGDFELQTSREKFLSRHVEGTKPASIQ